jgi:hypothetical protein
VTANVPIWSKRCFPPAAFNPYTIIASIAALASIKFDPIATTLSPPCSNITDTNSIIRHPIYAMPSPSTLLSFPAGGSQHWHDYHQLPCAIPGKPSFFYLFLPPLFLSPFPPFPLKIFPFKPF